MTYALYNTDVLIAAIKSGKLATSFLRDRYFPKTELSQFVTNDVLVEYQDGNQKCAPFVVPHIGGIAVERKGYTAKRYEPANIEPKKILKIDDLNQKGFGEALLSGDTPAKREQKFISADLLELDDMTTRSEEVMAAEILLNNKCTMSYKTGDASKPEVREVRFYSETNNPYVYTPSIEWDEAGAKIIDDIFAICQLMNQKGIKAVDLIVTPAAMSAIRNDAEIIKLLDLRNYNVGAIDPQELPGGAVMLGKLNVDGYVLNLISYNEFYTNDSGTTTPYIPNGYIVVAAPATGQRLYGAVTQMESDEQLHTYAEPRVPKVIADKKTDKREIKMTAKPLLAPKQLGSWYSAKVVTV